MKRGEARKRGMEMEERREMTGMEDELLLAVRFLIYFMVSVIARKSKFDAIVGLDKAIQATGGYLEKEMKEMFPFL